MEVHATQPPTLSCLPTPWPSGSQVTGASSLWAAASAPHSQLIYFEWTGSSRGDYVVFWRHWGFCCLLFFWKHWGLCCFLFFWRHVLGDNSLGWSLPSCCLPLVASFCWLLHGALSFYCILCLDFLWVSSSIYHFFLFHLATSYEIVGGCWYIAVDTLRYSRLTLLLYPFLSHS